MPIRRLPTTWQAPVFLLNSRLGRFSAAPFGSRARSPLTYSGHPFSRSYGVILPSSFSMTHSSTLGFSPRLPVSVCGTVGTATPARGFSRRPASRALDGGITPPSGSDLTSNPRDLPRRPGYLLPSGLPAPDGPSASASPLAVGRNCPGTGIFARFPSPTPRGLGLGAG